MVTKLFVDSKEGETVNHKYGEKKLNYYKCLEWMTFVENTKHAYRTGLSRGYEQKRKKVVKLDVRFRLLKEFESMGCASTLEKMSIASLHYCCYTYNDNFVDGYQKYIYKGFIWMFSEDYNNKNILKRARRIFKERRF